MEYVVRMRALETERIILRPLTKGDLGDLHRLYGDERVMQFITGAPRTKERTRERLQVHLKQHEDYAFGLCAAISKCEKRVIGRCGLEPREEAKGVAGELAWMFEPQCWGRGLGSEAASALLTFGFEDLKLHCVFATADHRNNASISIMEKLGMKLVTEDQRGVEYEVRR